MNLRTSSIVISVLLAFAPLACGSGNDNAQNLAFHPNEEFKAYWNQGLAEISSYQLTQARYGELRTGTAVLVFVTEPFSTKDQVKSDRPEQEESKEVLKLNFTRKFKTGVYPYSMMNSSFVPTDYPGTGSMIKSTCSSQEWCGHTFSQWNKTKKGYRFQQFSYFQSEGDKAQIFDAVLLEDELWSTVRLDPNLLPTGELEVIPGNVFNRLKHSDIQAYTAIAKLIVGADQSSYTLEYPSLKRSLKLVFESAFPYRILSFEESYPDGWGANSAVLTTVGELKEQIMLDYWNKNANADSTYRKMLDLD